MRGKGGQTPSRQKRAPNSAALSRVSRNLKGAVAEECARVLQEMQFGMSRAEALRALAGRTDIPELRAFALRH